jgi:hypothetical protein
MRVVLFAAVCCFAGACATTRAVERSASPRDARAWVTAGITAMGGEARLAALSRVRIEAAGHEYQLEQSERIEAPQFVSYLRVVEVHDIAQVSAVRITSDLSEPEAHGASWAATQGDHALIGQDTSDTSKEPQFVRPRFARPLAVKLAPEALLVTAAAASDLAAVDDADFQGVSHRAVAFSVGSTRVRMSLDAVTSLPATVEFVTAEPDNVFWSPWGDVTVRVTYSNWQRNDSGAWYPMQWDEWRNGMPLRTLLITRVVPGGTLTPDESSRLERLERGVQSAPPLRAVDATPLDPSVINIAPGVVQLPGRWNVGVVQQEDGIVVLDAPLSPSYSARVLEKVQVLFPGERVKAVVTTSTAYPHFGGLREYVARGIPVYATDVNAAIVGRLVRAPHRLTPDALERSPRPLELIPVHGRVILGHGRNAIELIPVRRESGDRMLIVHFPGARLLYTSDLVQRGPDGAFFAPDALEDLEAVVKGEHLKVDRSFGFHVGDTRWSDVEAELQRTGRAPKPEVGDAVRAIPTAPSA